MVARPSPPFQRINEHDHIRKHISYTRIGCPLHSGIYFNDFPEISLGKRYHSVEKQRLEKFSPIGQELMSSRSNWSLCSQTTSEKNWVRPDFDENLCTQVFLVIEFESNNISQSILGLRWSLSPFFFNMLTSIFIKNSSNRCFLPLRIDFHPFFGLIFPYKHYNGVESSRRWFFDRMAFASWFIFTWNSVLWMWACLIVCRSYRTRYKLELRMHIFMFVCCWFVKM